MSKDNNHNNYSATDIEKYWKGQLTPQEMHAIEKAALDDPFLADAMEGYRIHTGSDRLTIAKDINELKKRLKDRIEDKKIAVMPPTKWWRLAAVFILLAGMGAVVYRLLVNENSRHQLAAKKENVTHENKITGTLNDSSVLNNVVSEKDSSILLAKTKNKVYKSDSQGVMASADITQQLASKANGIKSSLPTEDAAKYYTPAIQDSESKELSFKKEPEKVKQKFSNADSNYVFLGRVMDNNYRPVTGASIYIPGLQRNVATDANGFFNFYANDTIANVTVNSKGFEQTNTLLRKSTSANNIFLKENENILSGKASVMVVSGYGSRADKSLTKNKAIPMNVQNAMPVIGWSEYDLYIEKNKKIPDSVKNKTGKVVVSFFVDRNGELSKFNIETSVSALLDKEAIRLIDEGPKWKLLKKKKAKATVSIWF